MGGPWAWADPGRERTLGVGVPWAWENKTQSWISVSKHFAHHAYSVFDTIFNERQNKLFFSCGMYIQTFPRLFLRDSRDIQSFQLCQHRNLPCHWNCHRFRADSMHPGNGIHSRCVRAQVNRHRIPVVYPLLVKLAMRTSIQCCGASMNSTTRPSVIQ